MKKRTRRVYAEGVHPSREFTRRAGELKYVEVGDRAICPNVGMKFRPINACNSVAVGGNAFGTRLECPVHGGVFEAFSGEPLRYPWSTRSRPILRRDGVISPAPVTLSVHSIFSRSGPLALPQAEEYRLSPRSSHTLPPRPGRLAYRDNPHADVLRARRFGGPPLRPRQAGMATP